MVLDEAADAEVEPPGWEWEWEWEWEWWEWWWEDSPITKAKSHRKQQRFDNFKW